MSGFAVIEDRETVARLVAMLLEGRVIPEELSTMAPVTHQLIFHLDDGSTFRASAAPGEPLGSRRGHRAGGVHRDARSRMGERSGSGRSGLIMSVKERAGTRAGQILPIVLSMLLQLLGSVGATATQTASSLVSLDPACIRFDDPNAVVNGEIVYTGFTAYEAALDHAVDAWSPARGSRRRLPRGDSRRRCGRRTRI